MNKRFAVLAVVLVLALPALYADIGENFEAGGIAVSGGGNFYIDFGPILDSTEEYTRWTVTVEPGIDLYAARNLTLFLDPWFTYTSRQYDLSNIDRSMDIGAMLGVRYYFVRDPKAQRGLVPSLGAGVGIDVTPGVGDLVSDVETDNQSLNIWAGLVVPFRLYFFINDRLAPYIGLTPSLWYWLSYKDSTGTSVTLLNSDRLYLDARLLLGIAFFVPSKKAALISF